MTEEQEEIYTRGEESVAIALMHFAYKYLPDDEMKKARDEIYMAEILRKVKQIHDGLELEFDEKLSLVDSLDNILDVVLGQEH